MDYSVVWSGVNNPTHTYPIVFIIKLKTAKALQPQLQYENGRQDHI